MLVFRESSMTKHQVKCGIWERKILQDKENTDIKPSPCIARDRAQHLSPPTEPFIRRWKENSPGWRKSMASVFHGQSKESRPPSFPPAEGSAACTAWAVRNSRKREELGIFTKPVMMISSCANISKKHRIPSRVTQSCRRSRLRLAGFQRQWSLEGSWW